MSPGRTDEKYEEEQRREDEENQREYRELEDDPWSDDEKDQLSDPQDD